jgi:hypothetical protein
MVEQIWLFRYEQEHVGHAAFETYLDSILNLVRGQLLRIRQEHELGTVRLDVRSPFSYLILRTKWA